MGRRGEVHLTSRIIVAAWLALYSGHVASAQNYQAGLIFTLHFLVKLVTHSNPSIVTPQGLTHFVCIP